MQAALTAAQGGHSTGVQAMITISQPLQFLISADWEGNMKVRLVALLNQLIHCIPKGRYVPEFTRCLASSSAMHSTASCKLLMTQTSGMPLSRSPTMLDAAQVWDLASGSCTQTIAAAHRNVIMSLLFWEVRLLHMRDVCIACRIVAPPNTSPDCGCLRYFTNWTVTMPLDPCCSDTIRNGSTPAVQGFVISCSLDATVRVWPVLEAPAPGAVLDPTPAYTHPPEEDAASTVRSRLQARPSGNLRTGTQIAIHVQPAHRVADTVSSTSPAWLGLRVLHVDSM